MKKTAVYTRVNGDMQRVTHRKQQIVYRHLGEVENVYYNLWQIYPGHYT